MSDGAQTRATLIGCAAIALWGLLALLTDMSGNVPPFQLTFMTFAIAFALGAAQFAATGRDFSVFRQPARVWLNGVLGLFGYHALYFAAMRFAPALEVSLINYLWPVLIVALSALSPGERLQRRHLLGVALGFAGVAVLLAGNGGLRPSGQSLLGYALALSCALVWALYSVLSRRHSAAPTQLVTGYCGATALLSLVCHLLLEETVYPAPAQWLPIALLGVGPVGLAFFAWDRGVKKGNLRLLGTLSYGAPLLSSVVLLCFGRAEWRWTLLAACLLIAAGSAVAARRPSR